MLKSIFKSIGMMFEMIGHTIGKVANTIIPNKEGGTGAPRTYGSIFNKYWGEDPRGSLEADRKAKLSKKIDWNSVQVVNHVENEEIDRRYAPNNDIKVENAPKLEM